MYCGWSGYCQVIIVAMETRADEQALKLINAAAATAIAALRQLEITRRQLHATTADSLGKTLDEPYRMMRRSLDKLLITDWPGGCAEIGDAILEASSQIKTMLSDFRGAAKQREKIWEQRLALRSISLVEGMLYPYAPKLPVVQNYFLEDGVLPRAAPSVTASSSGLRVLGPEVGIQHMSNKQDERSSASLYVPEYYQENQSWPLIIALHGASGQGRDYLFAWLRVAKSRGAIILAPTSIGATWSMLGQDVDAVRIRYLVEQVKSHYRINLERILTVGLSDGGTYGWMIGSDTDIGCTHLAVLSATLHPQVVAPDRTERLRNKQIYMLHGHLDELFPLSASTEAVAALKELQIPITYRDVPDLAHTVAGDENGAIMDWFGCPLPAFIG